MKSVLPIFFGVFLLITTTGLQPIKAADLTDQHYEITTPGDGLPLLHDVEESGSNSTSDAPLEESEDEDETSKEKLFHRMASANFASLLAQRFLRQHSIFEQLQLEIDTPPPRNS